MTPEQPIHTNAERFSFAHDVVLQVINGEAVILKLHDEVVFALNETGARIAQLLAAKKPLGAVVEILCHEYQHSADQVEREVTQLIDLLVSKRLLRPVASHEHL